MTLLHTIFNIVKNFFWFLAAVLVLLIVVINIPSLPLSQLGFYSFIISSPSMEPTIDTGDLIFIKSQAEYTNDDVITFTDTKNRTITHRIIAVNNGANGKTFTTKGDNNDTQDPDPVPVASVLGKWHFTIPKIGYFLVAIQKPAGVVLFFGVLITLLLLEMTIFKSTRTTTVQET